MNTEWKDILALLGVKTYVLIFFSMLLYKVWKNYGSPFFDAEYKNTLQAQQARESELAHLQHVLVEQNLAALTNTQRLEQIEKTFSAWREKTALNLAQEKDRQHRMLTAYIAQAHAKRITIQQYDNAKEVLSDVIAQTRANLVKIYANDTGSQALEKAITKISEQSKAHKA